MTCDQDLHSQQLNQVIAEYRKAVEMAAMIVVIEVNDPSADDVMDGVLKERSVLFWSVVAAGFVLGALDRIWNISA